MWPSHTGDYPALRGDPDPCSSVDEPGGHNAERNKPITKEQALRDSAQRRTHRSELPRDGSGCRQAGEGRRGVFRGDRASVWGDGEFWRWMWDVPVATAPQTRRGWRRAGWLVLHVQMPDGLRPGPAACAAPHPRQRGAGPGTRKDGLKGGPALAPW